MSIQNTNQKNNFKTETQQDAFLNHLIEQQIAVSIFLISGIRLQGNIIGFDAYTVFVIDKKREMPVQMIYKNNISTIMIE